MGVSLVGLRMKVCTLSTVFPRSLYTNLYNVREEGGMPAPRPLVMSLLRLLVQIVWLGFLLPVGPGSVEPDDTELWVGRVHSPLHFPRRART